MFGPGGLGHAVIRGGGRLTWWEKELWVVERDGSERHVTFAGNQARVALAPAWGPHGELAWVSGPAIANDLVVR